MAPQQLAVPRASLLTPPGMFADITSGIWMGGAHSHVGEEMVAATLRTSLVIDAAGDMPRELREVTGTWVPCVFADLDSIPVMMHRIHDTVERVVAAMRDERPPDAVFAVCQHGMNRSGLLAGLILREMGMPGDEVVALIRERRPGALSNRTFETLIRGGR